MTNYNHLLPLPPEDGLKVYCYRYGFYKQYPTNLVVFWIGKFWMRNHVREALLKRYFRDSHPPIAGDFEIFKQGLAQRYGLSLKAINQRLESALSKIDLCNLLYLRAERREKGLGGKSIALLPVERSVMELLSLNDLYGLEEVFSKSGKELRALGLKRLWVKQIKACSKRYDLKRALAA